jgi:hypothetical protein
MRADLPKPPVLRPFRRIGTEQLFDALPERPHLFSELRKTREQAIKSPSIRRAAAATRSPHGEFRSSNRAAKTTIVMTSM